MTCCQIIGTDYANNRRSCCLTGFPPGRIDPLAFVRKQNDLVARPGGGSSSGSRGSSSCNGGCSAGSLNSLRWHRSSHDHESILSPRKGGGGAHRETLNVRPTNLYWFASNNFEELRSWAKCCIASCCSLQWPDLHRSGR